MSIYENLRNFLKEAFLKVCGHAIVDFDTTFSDQGLDSLCVLGIIMEFENEFDIIIPNTAANIQYNGEQFCDYIKAIVDIKRSNDYNTLF